MASGTMSFNECDINKIILTNKFPTFNKCKVDKIEFIVKDSKREKIELPPEQIESVTNVGKHKF